jgi:hypothetical protein
LRADNSKLFPIDDQNVVSEKISESHMVAAIEPVFPDFKVIQIELQQFHIGISLSL